MRDLERFAPPGVGLTEWKNLAGVGLVGGAALSCLVFLGNLYTALNELSSLYLQEMLQNVRTWSFDEVLGFGVDAFVVFAVSMVAFVVENYLYYFKDSKSVYTMARVRSPLELHIRSWTLPLLGAGAMLLAREVLILLYFGIYCLVMPKSIPAASWEQLIGGLLI